MTYKKHPFLVLASLMLATPVSAATVPVFDWVNGGDSSLINTTIGGSAQVYKVEVDTNDGSIYVSGQFTGTPDFDPSGDTDEIASAGDRDAFLSKFDADGGYLWTKTWGSTAADIIRDALAVDTNSDVYVAGSFRGTVDFDPGPGEAFATSTGQNDVFFLKLNSDGEFVWLKTWGKTGSETGFPFDIEEATDGGVFVYGGFDGTVDFDPGPGEVFATSTGSVDFVLSKFDADGTFQWVKTWGSTGFDSATSLHEGEDGSVYLMGLYAGTTDFDPGAGVVSVGTNGGSDAFVLKLDTDGLFQWVRVWGGASTDVAYSANTDSTGGLYVAGYFQGTADLNPTDGTATTTSAGGTDALLMKLDSDGNFEWVKTWGSTGSDDVRKTVFFDDGYLVLGRFSETVDFDPDAGVDEKVAAGSDVSMSLFNLNDEYIRTDTFGGALDEWVDNAPDNNLSSGKALFGGFHKSDPADFDPSGKVAEHSGGGVDTMYVVSFTMTEPAVTITASDTTASEAGDTAAYSVVLTAPPHEDVVVTLTPDNQLSVSTTSLTFTSATWDMPQTVTVTAVDDEENENDPHTGVVTHTAASDDVLYDGITVGSVTVSIDENDSSSSSSSRSARAIQAITGAGPETPLQTAPLTPEQVQEAIVKVKQQLIIVIQQLIVLLQEEIARLSVQ